MTDPVFIHEGLAAVRPAAPSTITLDGSEARHASRAQRLGAGDSLMLTDGVGCALTGKVLSVDSAGSVIVSVERWLAPVPPRPRITLVQAIPKGAAAEQAVDGATQAGIDTIVPWQAGRSIARWAPAKAEKQHAKWVNAARVATKQSRRLFIPEIAACATSAQVAERLGALVSAGGTALVLHESATACLTELPSSCFDVSELAIVVGPEGGITNEEIHDFTQVGALPVLLGPEVVRSATAAMVAASALGVLTGRWLRP